MTEPLRILSCKYCERRFDREMFITHVRNELCPRRGVGEPIVCAYPSCYYRASDYFGLKRHFQNNHIPDSTQGTDDVEMAEPTFLDGAPPVGSSRASHSALVPIPTYHEPLVIPPCPPPQCINRLGPIHRPEVEKILRDKFFSLFARLYSNPGIPRNFIKGNLDGN